MLDMHKCMTIVDEDTQMAFGDVQMFPKPVRFLIRFPAHLVLQACQVSLQVLADVPAARMQRPSLSSSWQHVIWAENNCSRRGSRFNRMLQAVYLPRIRAIGLQTILLPSVLLSLQQSDFRGCSIDCLREPVKSAAVACQFCLLKPAGVRKATLPNSKVSWLPVCVDEVLWILKFLRDC